MFNVMSRYRKMIYLVPLIAVLALAAYLLLVGQATAQAQDPPGDCWGGALNPEPVTCYILEETQKDGLLLVEGIYHALNGPLYVLIAGDESVEDRGLPEAFALKAAEFVRTPKAAEYFHLESVCQKYNSREACISKEFSGPGFGSDPLRYGGEPYSITYHDKGAYAYSRGFAGFYNWPSGAYDNVYLLLGGAAARKERPGWASWRQLWPQQDVGPASAGADVNGMVFDVSDVDAKSDLGDNDCRKHIESYVVSDGYCGLWETKGHLGLAGVHGHSSADARYYQVKEPIPIQSDKLEQLRLDIMSDHFRSIHEAGHFEVEIIPVKYDLGQLWKWAVILNRFAYSKGNTVGILGAGVGTNGVPINDPEKIREVIGVLVLDRDVATSAFPTLLPALGIPVDAVGSIGEAKPQPLRSEVALGFTNGAQLVDGTQPDSSTVGATESELLPTPLSPAVADSPQEPAVANLEKLSSDSHQSQPPVTKLGGQEAPVAGDRKAQMEEPATSDKPFTALQDVPKHEPVLATDAAAATAPLPPPTGTSESGARRSSTGGMSSWRLPVTAGVLALILLLGTGAYILHRRRA